MSGSYELNRAGATGNLPSLDVDLAPITVAPTVDAGAVTVTTEVGIPGDGLITSSGATSPESPLPVKKTEFPHKDENPEAYTPTTGVPTVTTTVASDEAVTETKPDGTTSADGTTVTDPVATGTGESQTETKTPDPGLKTIPITLGLDGNKLPNIYGNGLLDLKLEGGSLLDSPAGTIGYHNKSTKTYGSTASLIGPLTLGDPLLFERYDPTKSLSLKLWDWNGSQLSTDSYLKAKASMATERLSTFSTVAATKIAKEKVKATDDVINQVRKSIEPFSYLDGKNVNQNSQTFKAYTDLKALLREAEDPNLSADDRANLRAKLYSAIEKFTATMQKDLKKFNSDWSERKGGDPALRQAIAAKYQDLVDQAQLVDKNGEPVTDAKKVVFTDANFKSWPPSLQDAMKAHGAKNVNQLLGKLGLNKDGVLGPQAVWALQLHGLNGVFSGLQSYDNEARREIESKTQWVAHLEALGTKGVDGLIKEHPEVLAALANLPPDAKVAGKPDEIITVLKNLTKGPEAPKGIKVPSTNLAYLVKSLHEKGFSVQDGQLVKAGAPLTTDDYKTLSADIRKEGIQKLSTKIGDVNKVMTDLGVSVRTEQKFTELQRRWTDLSTEIQELKLDPKKEVKTVTGKFAKVLVLREYDGNAIGGSQQQDMNWLKQAISGGLKVEPGNEEHLKFMAAMRQTYGDANCHLSDDGTFTIDMTVSDKGKTEDLIDITLGNTEIATEDVDAVMDQVSDLRTYVLSQPDCNWAFFDQLGKLWGIDSEILLGMGLPLDGPLASCGFGDGGDFDSNDSIRMRNKHIWAMMENEGPEEPDEPVTATTIIPTTKPTRDDHPSSQPAPVAPDIFVRWALGNQVFDITDVTEDRTTQQEKIADKRRQADEKEREAYIAALDKKAELNHDLQEEAIEIADTNVVNGQMIQVNANGQVIEAGPAVV